MPWSVELFPHAVRDYHKMPGSTRHRIKDSLRRLECADEPLLQPGVRSLVGRLAGFHRLRVGEWRVIFELIPDRSMIAVHRIIPRKDAYKR
jgi:mRNA interferase RelE/StbE